MTGSAAASGSLAGFSPENILETFLAESNSGFIVLDTQLRVGYFNAVYNKLHQLHTGDFLLPNGLLIDLFFKDSFNEVMLNLQKSLAGETVQCTIKSLANNHTYWYSLKFYPLKNTANEISGAGITISETFEEKTFEGSIEQNEALCKTFIYNSGDVFVLADKKFEFKYISENSKNVLGYTPGELINKNGLDNLHPDDAEKVKEWFESVQKLDDELLSIEYRVKNKKGDWIWIENFACNRLASAGVKAIVMNLRNIQAKKTADQALVQAEYRMSLLLNNTDESFIILNSRLRIVAYNRAAQEHSPYFFTRELQSALSILDLINAEEAEEIIEVFERVFDGEHVERETTFVGEDNQPHIYNHIYRAVVDDVNDIFGVFITSTDITQRTLAERQLRESEIRFKTIIQESFDAVLITDATSNIKYCSPSITNLLGYTAEALIGKRGLDIIHLDYLRVAEDKFFKVVTSANSEKNIDVKMRHANDGFMWIEVKAKNMFDNNHVQGILVTLRDITYRKEAEEIISLSEQRFKGLVQSGADMISILDIDGIIQYSSPTVKYILGIDPSSHIGKNFFDCIHSDDRHEVKEKFDNMFISHRNQVSIGPYRYHNFEGKLFWIVSTITNLLGDPSIKGIVLNSRDITDRKKLTEELAANTERLKTAQRIAKLGYLEFDFNTEEYFFSEELRDILDLKDVDENEDFFSALRERIHPEDIDRVRAEVLKAIQHLTTINIELRLVVNKGGQKVLLAMGVPLRNRLGLPNKYSIIVQDITDTRNANLALQNLEGRFKALFDNSIDGILITSQQGVILAANPALCAMAGYSAEEILGIIMAHIFSDTPQLMHALEARHETGLFIGELTIIHKDRHLIPIEITSIKLKDAEDNIYYANIMRDITAKKKNEEEQKLLTEELIKNNKDLQQFSFITSHNLRAPVANLLSLLSLFDKENPAEEFNRLLIDKFEEATQQLNSTLNDLINVLVIKSNTNVEKETVHFSAIFSIVKKNLEGILLKRKEYWKQILAKSIPSSTIKFTSKASF